MARGGGDRADPVVISGECCGGRGVVWHRRGGPGLEELQRFGAHR
jgi:hypothetical protein